MFYRSGNYNSVGRVIGCGPNSHGFKSRYLPFNLIMTLITTNSLFFFNNINSLTYNEFLPILIFLTIAILLSFILIGLSYLLAVQNPETEKLSTYECGFEPYEDARNIFDVKFYLVAILFIVFDIETMFLIPWSISLSKISILGFWSMIDFLIELGIGFVYIWYIGALEWD